ncbi:MAG: hypothetical protein ASARMPRED_005871 [Alectoria sarmentosa]|nr:MAG: hypothetical protein ASARMPRED_005871 [Alectoria sarmentosa]
MVLEAAGCGARYNINLFTPEHVVPQVVLSILHAKELGLRLPIVYNTSAFDSLESLESLDLLDGLVDIYLPDFNVWTKASLKRLLKAEDYASAAMESIKAMHAQVGDLCFSPDGIAKKGLLVRHLVMPGKENEGQEIMQWLGDEIFMLEADGISVVSGGLPTIMGANEDATDEGTPAEVNTPTMDELSSSEPGRVVTREDTEFGRLETSVVVNATMGSSEIGSVEIVDSSTGLETDRPVKVPDEVVSLLELGCTVDVVAALKDVVIWIKLMAVVNVFVDRVCEELGCELKLLNSAELCGMLASEDAEELGDKMVIDDNTGCDAEVGEVLLDNRVVDVSTEKTAEVAREVADVVIVDEVIVEIAELVIEEFGVEVATDRTVEVVGGVTGTKEGARTVESAIVDRGTVVEGNVVSALNEAATPEDVISAVDEIAVAEDDVGRALVETTTAKDVARTVDKAVAAEDSPFQER